MIEFGLKLAADGAHGGALGVSACGFGFDLGFDRLEIDKPASEEGLGDLFEGLIDLAVEFDFVVERAQEISYVFLMFNGGDCKLKIGNIFALQAIEYSACIDKFLDLTPPLWTANQPTQKRREDFSSISP